MCERIGSVTTGDVLTVLSLAVGIGTPFTVGLVLLLRGAGKRVAWILLAGALSIVVVFGAHVIGTPWALVVGSEWTVLFLWPLALAYVYPDGRLPSRRWRPLLWAGLALVALAVLGTLFGVEQGDWDGPGAIRNPLAIGGPVGDALESGAAAGAPLFGVLVLLALASVVGRFRRARGVERQQLKWFGYAIGLLLCGLAAAAVSEATGWQLIGDVGWTVFLASLIFGMPLAIGVAILRYRLYDIDLVIRRTLVYGALTLTLGAAYLGSVLLVGLAVGQSGFATAVSTLAVAALFRPARARIQAVVDQRFYRRRYDAALTLEAFGVRLRDELDLEALAADVRGVVQDTVQPAHVSLWLRSGG